MAWSRHSSQQTQLLDLLHPLDDRDAEGAPLLAVPAGDAVLRPGGEGLLLIVGIKNRFPARTAATAAPGREVFAMWA